MKHNEVKRQAKLIAAAPEMLELLQEAYDTGTFENSRTKKNIRLLIAKLNK